MRRKNTIKLNKKSFNKKLLWLASASQALTEWHCYGNAELAEALRMGLWYKSNYHKPIMKRLRAI